MTHRRADVLRREYRGANIPLSSLFAFSAATAEASNYLLNFINRAKYVSYF